MKLKLDESGNVVLSDGKPVYVHDDGKEIPFDVPQAFAKIKELNAESKKWREQFEDAKKKVDMIGDMDIEKAKIAMELADKIETKKLIDSGELDKATAEMAKAMTAKTEEITRSMQAKLDSVQQERDELKTSFHSETLKSRFSTSEFLKKQTFLTPAVAMKQWESNLKMENGKIVPYDKDGNKIYSRKNAGELAEFDEAVEVLFDGWEEKSHYRRGSDSTGPGFTPGGQRPIGTEWHKLTPTERLNAARGVKS